MPHENLNLHSISFCVEATSLFVFLRVDLGTEQQGVTIESCCPGVLHTGYCSDHEKLQGSQGERAGPTELMGAPLGPVQAHLASY